MKLFITLSITILLCSIVSSIPTNKLNLAQSKSKSGDLKYYHRFEKRHTWIPNSHIPLQKHYHNEKELREAEYRLEDKINHLKRGFGFQERTKSRNILADENTLAANESKEKADNRLHGQREMAIKEQINHEEKFRTKYKHRAEKNKKKLEHALPDEVPEYTTLENFDEERVKHFTGALKLEQDKLNHQKQADMSADNELRNANADLEGRIDKEKGDLKTARDNYNFKVAGLEAEHAQLQEMVHAEEHLDDKRRHNEHIEEEEASQTQQTMVVKQ